MTPGEFAWTTEEGAGWTVLVLPAPYCPTTWS